MNTYAAGAGPGILAIWNDCETGFEDEYERWYTQDHLPERVGVAGFRFGRRYEAVAAEQRYFTFYETESPAVLATPAYLDLLDQQSEWTARVMPHFRDMSRTVCQEIARRGIIAGACAVTLRHPASLPDALIGELAARPEVLCLRHWRAMADGGPRDTEETRARGGPDATIGEALVIETAREAAARAIAGTLAVEGGETGIYRLLCQLNHEDVGEGSWAKRASA